ncbi:MAG: glycerol kinase GlpK [Clostridia bacterium]|nr:glycerol kinase GlpK [Clostridia bacterium]
MEQYLLALDQGTTSSRAILFDTKGRPVQSAQYEFTQIYPAPGQVEHDPREILSSQLRAVRDVLKAAAVQPGQVAAIGVTNQRETAIVWDKSTGEPVHNAIVWQCRRTAPLCEQLRAEGLEDHVKKTTGLVIDAYFSATKIRHILDNVPDGQARAEKGELLFGTVDSYLIWNLTGRHMTDYSNAARTMLFDIHQLCWDETLLARLNIPRAMLPEVLPSSQVYGLIERPPAGLEALKGVPIAGDAGDQQAALFGQACFAPGACKCTYGTGSFVIMQTGDIPVESRHGLLTTIAWGLDGKISYALEGSVFNAGSGIKWLRDELGLIQSAREIDLLAESVPDAGGAYFVSAFTGLGAPHWDMYARGALLGLTRGVTRAHICRAVLEGIAFQVNDLTSAMADDLGSPIRELRADGGAAVSDVLLQFQADLLGARVLRPACVESTALGAVGLAGLAVGVYQSTEDLSAQWQLSRAFAPEMEEARRTEQLRAWGRAVERSLGWVE